MRRKLWLLVLGLIAACVAPPGEPDGEEDAGWPDVTKNAGLKKAGGENRSARELLTNIIDTVGATSSSLPEKAEYRKTHKYDDYTLRVAWARVVIALRYTQEGKKAHDAGKATLRDKYYALAEGQLDGGDQVDDEWAQASYGPAYSARQYLNLIQEKCNEPPYNGGCPPSLQAAVLNSCEKLLEKHRAAEEDDDDIPLVDESAWARVVCAYYAANWGANWDLCKTELEHIDE